MAKQKECLVPGCGREVESRGLCGRCYTAARKVVAAGKATWEELESKGLARAPAHNPRGVFTKALAVSNGD